MGRHTNRGVVKAKNTVDTLPRFRVLLFDHVSMQGIEGPSMGKDGDVILRRLPQIMQNLPGTLHQRPPSFPLRWGKIKITGPPPSHRIWVLLLAIGNALSFKNSKREFTQTRFHFNSQAEELAEWPGGG